MVASFSKPPRRALRPLPAPVWAPGLVVVALALTACSRAPSESTPAVESAADAAETAGPAVCPFADEVKEVALIHLVKELELRLGSGYLFVLDDLEHGDALVARLQPRGLPLTNRVVVALHEGAVVEHETRQPAVMCALQIGEWSRDEVQVDAVWYASAEQEGTEPLRVIWQSPRWVVEQGTEEF